ncbi:MAG: hypothetical protein JW885_03300 [Deltaproteobacteria bacterium]|nr:hypothetical protein [Candidatus Zymogenaceae bacterium]
MQQKIKRMEKKFFMGVFLSPVVLAVIIILLIEIIPGTYGVFAALLEYIMEDTLMYIIGHNLKHVIEDNTIIFIITILYSVLLFTCKILFHYRMWAAIYDEQIDTPPKLAVLLLFIPLYNLYWIFKFYPGFVQYYNENIDRYGIGSEVQPIDKLVYTAYPVTQYISVIIVIVSALISSRSSIGVMNLVCFVVFIIMVSKTCDAVNTLADVVEEIPIHDTSTGHPANEGIKLLLDEVRREEGGND